MSPLSSHKMGAAAAGAMDANAFNAALRSGHGGVFLPDVSTLTYQGDNMAASIASFSV